MSANASVDVVGLTVFSNSVRRTISGDLQKELVRNIQSDVRTMRGDMARGAHTKIQRHAFDSVSSRRVTDGLEISGGRGAGLDAVLFSGGEYGGRKSKRVVYATRSRLGTPYIVRRRTTMQFLPHLGREGYFFWPAVRDSMKRLTKQQEDIVSKALS